MTLSAQVNYGVASHALDEAKELLDAASVLLEANGTDTAWTMRRAAVELGNRAFHVVDRARQTIEDANASVRLGIDTDRWPEGLTEFLVAIQNNQDVKEQVRAEARAFLDDTPPQDRT